jgi:putative peptidoglycan lipid II flippase
MTSLKSRFGLLVLLSAAGYAVTFFSQLVIAYNFGTSQALDSFWGGLALVSLFGFYVTPLREALVPAVHRARKQGDVHAGRVLSAGLSLLLALTSVSGLLLLLSAEGVASLISDTEESTRGGAVAALVPWLLPYLGLFVLAETLNAMLVSFNQVVRQALVRIVAALVLLATVAMVGASLGVGGLLLAQILSMATLVMASWMALRHLQLRLVLRAWALLRDSGMVPLFVSLLFTYFLAQLYVLVERSAMIYLGTGLVSGFQYSVVLVNALVSLLAYPLSNLVWSKFLAQAAEGDSKAAHVLATRTCGLLFYTLVVLCAFVWFNARDIVVLIYARGAFDEASIQLTTTALRATIFAAVPIGVSSVLGRWLISMPGGARRQFMVGLFTTVAGSLVIGLALLANSVPGIMMHWLFANLAAMVVSGFIFINAGDFSMGQKLAAGYWFVRVVLVAVLAAWITGYIEWGASNFEMLALVVRAVLYLLVVAGLTWLFRMMPSLRRMLQWSV